MDKELPDLEECFCQGTQARAQGLSRADNPYDLQTPEHREWLAGWSATLDLDEDDDPESMRVKPGHTDKDAHSAEDDEPASRRLSG